MQKTEPRDGVTITAHLKTDNSVNLAKKMQYSFLLDSGETYEGEAMPETSDGLEVGGMAAQFGLIAAVRKLKNAVRRGGKREGAGRKPKGDKPKVQYATWLNSEVVDIIRDQENQSEFIETAVRAYVSK